MWCLITIPCAIIVGLIVVIQFCIIMHQMKMLNHQHRTILMLNNGELDRKINNIINQINKELTNDI